jgi:translation initiation factor IF-1
MDELLMEHRSERILSKQEIMVVLSRYTEGKGEITREPANKDGIYLLEVTTKGPQEGETTEFTYRRKGTHTDKIRSPETVIDVCYWKDGMPHDADTLATYNSGAGEWTHYSVDEIDEIDKVYKKVIKALGKKDFNILLEKGYEYILEAYKKIL